MLVADGFGLQLAPGSVEQLEPDRWGTCPASCVVGRGGEQGSKDIGLPADADTQRPATQIDIKRRRGDRIGFPDRECGLCASYTKSPIPLHIAAQGSALQ